MNYQERQQLINIGEVKFETYCAAMGYKITRLGFDEKHNNVQGFYNLNPFLRNIPDYVVNTEDSMFVVNVKGTANFKQSELKLLPEFMEWYATKKAPLVYAFCFAERDRPILLYPEKIIELYQKEKDKKWQDGTVYRTLTLPK